MHSVGCLSMTQTQLGSCNGWYNNSLMLRKLGTKFTSLVTSHLMPSHKLLVGITTKLWTGKYWSKCSRLPEHDSDLHLHRFESTIAGQFFGHTHKDSFRVFFDEHNITRATRLAPHVMFIPGLHPLRLLTVIYYMWLVRNAETCFTDYVCGKVHASYRIAYIGQSVIYSGIWLACGSYKPSWYTGWIFHKYKFIILLFHMTL